MPSPSRTPRRAASARMTLRLWSSRFLASFARRSFSTSSAQLGWLRGQPPTIRHPFPSLRIGLALRCQIDNRGDQPTAACQPRFVQVKTISPVSAIGHAARRIDERRTSVARRSRERRCLTGADPGAIASTFVPDQVRPIQRRAIGNRIDFTSEWMRPCLCASDWSEECRGDTCVQGNLHRCFTDRKDSYVNGPSNAESRTRCDHDSLHCHGDGD
jgi:hypothetical protein